MYSTTTLLAIVFVGVVGVLASINEHYLEEETRPAFNYNENVPQIENDINVENEETGDDEIVELGGLLRAHAFAARARGALKRRRFRARAKHLHHRLPLLRSSTPDFLNSNEAHAKEEASFQFGPLTDEQPILASQQSRTSETKHFDRYSPSIGESIPFDSSEQAYDNNQQYSNHYIDDDIIYDDDMHTNKKVPLVFPNFEAPPLIDSLVQPHRYNLNPTAPVETYLSQPEMIVHNIDNSEEVERDIKPGFSIIPINWKPPPESNLYNSNYYRSSNGQDPLLVVFPGKWTGNYGDVEDVANNYDVLPIAYEFPDEYSYRRNSEDKKDGFTDFDNLEHTEERAAAPRHLKHIHDFIHKHVHKDSPSQASTQIQHQQFSQPEGFSQSQAQSGYPGGGFQQQFQSQSQTSTAEGLKPFSGFSESHGHFADHSSALKEISKRPLISINKQTTFVAPSVGKHDFQISQVSGSHNSVSQAQASQNFQHGIAAADAHSFQNSHVDGTFNSVSQAQSGTSFTENRPVFSEQNPQQQDQSHTFQSSLVSGHHNFINQGQSASTFTENKEKFDNDFRDQSLNHHNLQESEVFGAFNAVNQAQANVNQGGINRPSVNNKFQSSHITGTDNSVSQSQARNLPTEFLGFPYLTDIPRRNSVWRVHNDFTENTKKKRSISHNSDNDITISKIIQHQGKMIDDLKKYAKDDKEFLLIMDIASNLIDDFQKSLKSHVTKRHAPFLRLLVDPNAQLDIPNTLENIGTAARNSFENQRQPAYHIKNMAGSAKDIFLSTLRIVPQDVIIPSRYQIIDTKKGEYHEFSLPPKQPIDNAQDEIFKHSISAINPALLSVDRTSDESLNENKLDGNIQDDPSFSKTFSEVGSALRESIQSGQNTLSHIGDMYHNARKAISTSRNVVPRVLLSGRRVPVIQNRPLSISKNSEEAVALVVPHLIEFNKDFVGNPYEESENFVGTGNVMDALGFSNPNAEEVRFKVVPLPKLWKGNHIKTRSNADQSPLVGKYFILSDGMDTADTPDEEIKNTLKTLVDAKEAVGANTLQEFLLEIKKVFTGLFQSYLSQTKGSLNSSGNVSGTDYKKIKGKVVYEPVGKNPVTLKFQLKNPLHYPNQTTNDSIGFKSNNYNLMPNSNNSNKSNSSEEINDIVGAGLPLTKQLLTPFMGQPSQRQRLQFFEELKDSEEEQALEGFHQQERPQQVAAINPILFNKSYEPDLTGFDFLKVTTTAPAINTVTNSKSTIKTSNSTPEIISIITENKNNYSTQDTETTDLKSTATPFEATTQNGAKYYLTVMPTHAETFKPNIKPQEVATDTFTTETLTAEIEETTPVDMARTSMKMGKKLLTPFMGKPIQHQDSYYDDSYDADSDEELYLRNSEPNESFNLTGVEEQQTTRKIPTVSSSQLRHPLVDNEVE